MKPLLKSKKVLAAIISAIVLISIVVTTITITSKSNKKDQEDQLSLGEKYLTELDYDQAIATFKGVIELEPRNKQAHFGLAKAYEGKNDYDRAEATYKKIIDDIDNADVDAYSELAELYIRLEKLDEAKDLLKEAAERTKNKEIEELYMITQPSPPEFSVAPGTYQVRQAVELIAANEDERIYYTLDGSEPTEEAQNYTEPIILPNGITVIKAFVKNSRGYTSEVVTAEYNMDIELREVSFQDFYIESIVRQELELSYYSPIYNEDVERITSLTIVGNNIIDSDYRDTVYFYEDRYSVYGYTDQATGYVTSLTDLDKFIFLKELNIAYQDNLDLTGIDRCKNLEELSLINNGISNVEAIGRLTSLRKLCLAWNEISDISPLSGLVNLTSLGLWGNRIRDISPVANLTNLEYLDFSDNMIEDISPVAGLTKLNALWMYNNRVSDIAALTNLSNLSELMLRDNPLQNMDTLKSIYPRLTRLDVSPY